MSDKIVYGKPFDYEKPIAIEALPNYQLLITYSSCKKVYNVLPMLEYPLFSSLKNPVLFNKVKIDSIGGAYWNDKLDIAPEALYFDSKPYLL